MKSPGTPCWAGTSWGTGSGAGSWASTFPGSGEGARLAVGSHCLTLLAQSQLQPQKLSSSGSHGNENFLLPKVELSAGRQQAGGAPGDACAHRAPDAAAPRGDPFGGSCWLCWRSTFGHPVLLMQS